MSRQGFTIAAPVLAACLMPGVAIAQADEQAQASADNNAFDIVVTAQRREQSVLEVPLSIQALSGDQLQDAGVKDLSSLQFTTPGFVPNTGSGFTQIFIRGIGNSIFVGADPSVATFIDDVPRIYGTMAHDLVDVERVEVLKGAQGGLYGRNATGGVVNIVTRKPDFTAAGAEGRVSYGERNSFRGSAFLNLPVSEAIAFSLSAERVKHDAYVRNIASTAPYAASMFPAATAFGTPQQTADFLNAAVNPNPLHDEDFWSVNGKLRIEPTSNLSLMLTADFSDKDDNNGQGLYNTTPEYTQAYISGLLTSVGIPNSLPSGFGQNSGKFESAQGVASRVKIREHGVSAVAKLDLEGVEITSITAHRKQRTFFTSDASQLAAPSIIFDISYPFRKVFYQELRAVSQFTGPLQVLGGVTYLKSSLKGATRVFLLTPSIPIATTEVDQTVKNWSVYGQASFDITEGLTLTASGRYIHEKNDTLFSQPVVSRALSTNKKFVPSATLSYALDDGVAYVRWARGFKTGGINLTAAPFFFPRPQDGSVFGPETVDTYELGYRQALFDRQIQFTTSIFYNDYRNIQISARSKPEFPAISSAVVNAKSARTYGIEAGVNWRVADPLTVAVNAGYLNAKYRDFKLAGSAVLADFDLSGKQMPNAPKWQLSFNAAVDQPLNDDLRLVGNVLAAHTGKVLFLYSALPGVVPDSTGDSFWLVNARIGLKTADDRLGIAVVADNLFNKAYNTFGVSQAVGNNRTWGDRRVIRGEISGKF